MEREKDTYRTIKKASSGLYKDKGSKFISFAFPVKDEDEINSKLAGLKKEYHDARHHCYAWSLGYDGESHRYNDDGEPSGTAGKPIFGQIRSFTLCNILIVVVRYFGGTKLGVRGLINAYKGAALDSIENNTIITNTIQDHYRVRFEYPQMNDIMRVLKENDLPQIKHDFGLDCSLEFSVRLSKKAIVIPQLEQIKDVELDYLYRL